MVVFEPIRKYMQNALVGQFAVFVGLRCKFYCQSKYIQMSLEEVESQNEK